MNTAFQPSKIIAYNSLTEFGFVPKTGTCIDNKDVKNCEHLNQNITTPKWWSEPVMMEVKEEPNEEETDAEIDIMKAIEETKNQEESIQDYIDGLLNTPLDY